MSSKFSLAALQLEQVTTGIEFTSTTNHKPICGRVSVTRRLIPGDNHAAFHSYHHNCPGGSQGKIPSQ